jgi:hypothetical protein
MIDEHLRNKIVTQQHSVLEVCPLVVGIAAIRRGAVSEEQGHTPCEALLHSGTQ